MANDLCNIDAYRAGFDAATTTGAGYGTNLFREVVKLAEETIA